MNRRHFILGSVMVGTAGLIALKPSDAGASYSDYFAQMNLNLREHGPFRPMMLLDLDILDRNIDVLKGMIRTEADYRIVVKSLPSPELVEYIMARANTRKLMVFHQPFLNHVAREFPDVDVLLGKPMPVKAAQHFYQQLTDDSAFKPELQVQWLIDTPERLDQYLALAKKLQVKMRINFEIDVGLHRGGLTNTDDLALAMNLIEANPQHLVFSGFMGYDPQVVKLPPIVKSVEQAFSDSQAIYQGFIDFVSQHYPQVDIRQLCLNGAGSPTIPLHSGNSVTNDVSAGSCLVKPIQFDIPSLDAFEPAAFIATPVLKKLMGTNIPALESFKDWQGKWDPNRQQTLFIYGGSWKAQYESPPGLVPNGLFGSSTNQQIINCSNKVNIDVDDHVFLRPEQSEFVFLQFGDILTVRQGELASSWKILAA